MTRSLSLPTSRRSFLKALPLLVPAVAACGRVASGSSLVRDAKTAPMLVGPILQNARPKAMTLLFEVPDSGDEYAVAFGPTPALGRTATATDGIRQVHGALTYQVDLEGLEPATRYHYRVLVNGVPGPTQSFRTPPRRGDRKPFTFAVYSDCQERPHVHQRIIQEGILANLEGHARLEDELGFVLIAGDVVHHGDVYEEYQDRLFGPSEELLGSVPLFTAIGNHEADSRHYWDYVSLPRNGTPGYEEHWYSFNYGNVHVIGLDTNPAYQVQEQLAWLEQDLEEAAANPDTDFIFAFFHHPYRSELCPTDANEFSGEIIRRLELALRSSDKAGAVFYGHSHGYQRGQSRVAPLYWVNAGSAGGSLDHWQDNDWQRPIPEIQISLDEYGVVLVRVNPNGKPAFVATRHGFGCENKPKCNELQDTFGASLDRAPPTRPTITQGETDAAGGEPKIHLLAEPFQDATVHLESQWQLSLTEDFSQHIDDQWRRRTKIFKNKDLMAGVNLAAATFSWPKCAASGDQLFARVRYRDEELSWSAWSAPFAIEPAS